MWRRTLLIRKGFLSSHQGSPKPHALHQVMPLRSSNISVQSVASSQSSSNFSTWVSKKPIFSRNLRRFSTDSDVGTPANSPPGSDIKSDMAESDQNVSAIDQTLNEILTSRQTLLLEDDEIVEVDEEKLENVLSLLQSSGGAFDGSLIASLEGMGFVLSNEFLVRVLQRLLPEAKVKIPIENLIAFFSWCVATPFYIKTSTVNALERALCSELKKSNAYALKDLGEKESGLLNTKTLNKLIFLFSMFRRNRAAFEVFNKFEEFGVADGDTYYYTIQALSKMGDFDLAYSVTQRMLIAGILPNAEKVGNIIFSLCRGNHLRAAYSVYMLAKAKNNSPPLDFVYYLTSCLCYLPRKDNKKRKYYKKYLENIYLALSMFEGLSGEDIKSMLEGFWEDTNFFYPVIQALCEIGDVEKAKELLFKMINAGAPPGEEIFWAIISGYVKRDAI